MRIDINTKKSWNDLSVKEILQVSSLWLQGNSEQAFLLKAFMLLHGLSPVNRELEVDANTKWYWMKAKGRRKPFLVDVDALTASAQQMSFLKDATEMKAIPFRWYRSPHSRLYNLNVWQYITAENYYMAYVMTKDTKHLCHLAAAIYLPYWRKFNDKHLNRRAQHFAKQKPEVIHAIFLFYSGARHYIKKRFPHIFKEVATGDSSQADSKKLTAIIRALNGGDVTKNPTIYRTPLIEALEQLDEMSEMAEKQKTQ